jgi:hypothetical protein
MGEDPFVSDRLANHGRETTADPRTTGTGIRAVRALGLFSTDELQETDNLLIPKYPCVGSSALHDRKRETCSEVMMRTKGIRQGDRLSTQTKAGARQKNIKKREPIPITRESAPKHGSFTEANGMGESGDAIERVFTKPQLDFTLDGVIDQAYGSRDARILGVQPQSDIRDNLEAIGAIILPYYKGDILPPNLKDSDE